MFRTALPQRFSRALFRLHIENGIAVALGMLVVGGGFYAAFGLATTVLAYTGAICASIVDQPGRFSIKPPIFAGAVLSTSLISLLASLCGGSGLLLGVLVAALSFASALISAYGRRALGLGVAAVLALVLGMSAQTQDPSVAFEHAGIFAAGGAAYAIFALFMAMVLDYRNRRIVLSEALRAFAGYLRAKADLFDPAEAAKPALRALIEAQGVLTENIQIARDMIFAGAITPQRARAVAALIALLDAFEPVLSSDADIEILRRSRHRHLLRRLRALIAGFAGDIDNLVIALAGLGAEIAPPDRGAELERIAQELKRIDNAPPADSDEKIAREAFDATLTKFGRIAAQLSRLFSAVHGEAGATPHGALELAPFMQQETISPRVLLAQFTLASPTMRYAIRLTLAMVAGCAVTFLFPQFVHGGWILLTTALIMRANYSITRQRRNDRVLGTLLGCVVTAALIHVLPGAWPLLGVVVAVGVSHAFGAVNYRVTALAASVSALLLIHFMAPSTTPLFFERVLDTLIGAALATGFSFLLPSWERRNIPQLIATMIAANRVFAQHALTREPSDQAYRLTRKNALDALAGLSSAIRRLLDEPQSARRAAAALNELLSANYLLASDLTSVHTAILARAKDVEPVVLDEMLAASRGVALEALRPDAAPLEELPDHRRRRGLGDMPATKAQSFLRRRLIHTERSARNVAALAARALR
ncbi:MAG TPA: FUSC family membrane protein [Rhizomicrobium sp.]